MADNPAAESLHNLDLNRFHRIYTTVHEMLRDRGYKPTVAYMKKKQWISHFLGYLAELEDPSSDLDVFGVVDNMTLIFSKRGASGKKRYLLVYFHPLDSKLCQNDMNYVHTLMKEKCSQELIIVANNKATPKVASVIGILGYNAQSFSEDELVFNVTKHQLVPRHCLAGKEEKEKILNTYTMLKDGKVHPELLPGMFTTEPIAKYFNFKVDDVVRVERPRPDGFYDLTYRIVIFPVTEKDG